MVQFWVVNSNRIRDTTYVVRVLQLYYVLLVLQRQQGADVCGVALEVWTAEGTALYNFRSLQ